MDDNDGKELLITMKEEIRKYRMDKYGAITYCEKEKVLCFGCLTEDGECKYEKCLHDIPEWHEQQARIEEKRRLANLEATKPMCPEKPKGNESKAMIETLWKTIRKNEDKANALYKAGESKNGKTKTLGV